MLLITIVSFFAILAQAANNSLTERKRTLEINLLSNLKARHKDAKIKCTIPHDINISSISSSDSSSNETESAVNTKVSIDDLSTDTQQHILSFLNTSELLNTRLLNSHHYKMSENANYLSIYNMNPYFVLKESWMNFKFGYFLFKYFENSQFNVDDLLASIHEILITFKAFDDTTPITMTILSFLYEYENGVGSSFPLNRHELYFEMMNANFRGHELPKSMHILNEYFDNHVHEGGYNPEQFRRTLETAIELRRSNADNLTIMTRLNFDPLKRIDESDFGCLPTFAQVFFFDLILPLCDRIEQIEEAIDISDCANIYSPFLLECLEARFPFVLRFFNAHNFLLFSKTLRALTRRFPRENIIGLDYLLTRDIANPFDIEIFKAMNPHIYTLISSFVSNISMSLTDIDIVAQMKEAGMFSSICRSETRNLIEGITSQSYRFAY